jgi:hypothetical protein
VIWNAGSLVVGPGQDYQAALGFHQVAQDREFSSYPTPLALPQARSRSQPLLLRI